MTEKQHVLPTHSDSARWGRYAAGKHTKKKNPTQEGKRVYIYQGPQISANRLQCFCRRLTKGSVSTLISDVGTVCKGPPIPIVPLIGSLKRGDLLHQTHWESRQCFIPGTVHSLCTCLANGVVPDVGQIRQITIQIVYII